MNEAGSDRDREERDFRRWLRQSLAGLVLLAVGTLLVTLGSGVLAFLGGLIVALAIVWVFLLMLVAVARW